MTTHLTLGLRFHRGDARLLNRLADRVRRRELQGDVSTFEQAALAAELNEPLVVHCTAPVEAHALAAWYAELGCRHPTVEQLVTPGG